jgi:type II secretory pathway component PulF
MAIELNAQPAGSTKKHKRSLSDIRLFEQRPGVKERMFFTEQLALLLETGTALHAALQLLKQQSGNPGFVRVIDALHHDIAEGKTFSTALARHPSLFPVTYVNLVGAAENGGFLDKVLRELVEMDERREQLHSKLISALSYPVFLILFSTAVVIFVLVAVFPKFADLFSSIRDQLPVTTIALMNASTLLLNYWWALLAGLLASGTAVVYWLRTPRGGEMLDRFKLRTFYLRDIFVQLYLVQSLRVMGLSLGNGVSVMDTLASCRDVVENRLYRRFINQVEAKVQEGEGLAAAFAEAEFIPPAVRQMVSTGEETGNLPRVMSRVAAYYERELDKRLAAFARAVEPMMLIVMGAVVGLIVSSLILPIFKLSRAVS